MKYYFTMLTLLFNSCIHAQEYKDTLLELYSGFIYFDTNKFVIDDNNQKVLKQLVDTFPTIRGRHYIIESHTDDVGSDESNMLLSENRSNATTQALIDLGIEPQNVMSKFYGLLNPISSNNTKEGKSLNRRTKISVLKYFKLRLLQGKFVPDSIIGEPKAQIFVSNKLYKDSIWTDNEGNFSIFVPYRQKINIEAFALNYFSQSKVVTTEDNIFLKPLSIKLPAIKLNKKFTLNNINFEGNLAIPLPSSMAILESLYKTMILNNTVCFEIGGHVNLPGPPEYFGHTYNLAVDRATFVYDYLVSKLISPSRMAPKGYSNFMMLYPKPETKREESLNRRVEITIKSCDTIKKYNAEKLVFKIIFKE